MRTIFMGTGEIALPTLRWLIEAAPDYELTAVFTQPDKKVGRKQELTPPEVKTIALAAGLPVYQPESLRHDPTSLEQLRQLNPELIIVMAYGQILPKAIIQCPTIACINLHASLLPRHRGASPIQAAIASGDQESGITLMHVVPKLDAGAMILKVTTPIYATDTGQSLHDRLATMGPELLRQAIPLWDHPPIPSEDQDESQVTYSGKLEREHASLDWQLSATSLERLIRAYDPWPGTHTWLPVQGELKKLKIFPHAFVVPGGEGIPPGTIISSQDGLHIACGSGSLMLQGEVQLEGRKRLAIREFLRGSPLAPGTICQPEPQQDSA